MSVSSASVNTDDSPVSSLPDYRLAVREVWNARKSDLTDWVLDRLVNRDDCYGSYRLVRGKSRPTTKPWGNHEDGTHNKCAAQPGVVDRVLIESHFAARSIRTIVGLHALGLESDGKWVAGDIDSHGADNSPQINEDFAKHVYNELVGLDFRPLLYESDGVGGFHVRVLFSEPVVGTILNPFGCWMLRDWKEQGVTKLPEVYPDRVDRHTDSGFGGKWLRVIGRFKMTDGWSKVWNGSSWLEGGEAIDHLLSLTGDSSDLIPQEAKDFVRPEQPKNRRSQTARQGRRREARESRQAIEPRNSNRNKSDYPDLFGFFNAEMSRQEVREFIESYGWTFRCESGEQLRFRRPGVHQDDASQDSNIRLIDGVPIFYVHTTSDPILLAGSYSPARLWCTFMFAGDWGRFRQWLWEEKGYANMSISGQAENVRDNVIENVAEAEVDHGDSQDDLIAEINISADGDIDCPDEMAADLCETGSQSSGVATSVLTAPPDEPPPSPNSRTGSSSAKQPEIEINHDLYGMTVQTFDFMAQCDPGIFQKDGSLVHIQRGVKPPRFLRKSEDSLSIQSINVHHLSVRISKCIKYFVKGVKKKITKATKTFKQPPPRVVQAVCSTPNSAIRPLTAVVTSPVFRPDGTLITDQGYDEATGIYFESCNCPPVNVPFRPTAADVRCAIGDLYYPFKDFPFVDESHKSSALAAMMTIAVRYAFDGPAPLFLVDSNRAGTGKGLLADALVLIPTGMTSASMTNVIDDNEMRKRIFAIALGGESIIKIDNIGEKDGLGTPSLDSAITTQLIGDRLLGVHEYIKTELIATWLATGNNVRLNGDMARRTCHIRLETGLENPGSRSDVSEKNLRVHIRRDRGRYLQAILTIIRAWYADQPPLQDIDTWGSFEEWSDIVRQVIVWIGMPDPYATNKRLLETADPDSALFNALLLNLAVIDPQGLGLTSERILQIIKQPENNPYYPEAREALKSVILELVPPYGTDLPTAVRIGKRLGSFRDRVAQGRKFIGTHNRDGITVWISKPL
jgi:hypothetical protein